MDPSHRHPSPEAGVTFPITVEKDEAGASLQAHLSEKPWPRPSQTTQRRAKARPPAANPHQPWKGWKVARSGRSGAQEVASRAMDEKGADTRRAGAMDVSHGRSRAPPRRRGFCRAGQKALLLPNVCGNPRSAFMRGPCTYKTNVTS